MANMPSFEATRVEQQKRDWIATLGPTVLAILISVAVQCVTVAWYFGTLNNRVAVIEDRQRLDEKEWKEDLKDVAAYRNVESQTIDLRLNRMDDKLDRLLESKKQ